MAAARAVSARIPPPRGGPAGAGLRGAWRCRPGMRHARFSRLPGNHRSGAGCLPRPMPARHRLGPPQVLRLRLGRRSKTPHGSARHACRRPGHSGWLGIHCLRRSGRSACHRLPCGAQAPGARLALRRRQAGLSAPATTPGPARGLLRRRSHSLGMVAR